MSEVAVIGVKDEKWGERPLVLVVLRAEHLGKVDRSDIQQHLKDCAERGAISKYAATDNVRFVESIERTSVGKLDKKVLRGKYGSSA